MKREALLMGLLKRRGDPDASEGYLVAASHLLNPQNIILFISTGGDAEWVPHSRSTLLFRFPSAPLS